VIVEGLFAWRAPFDSLIDIKVYLDVNFWHRYVLRLQRNIMDLKVADFQKITEQYFTFVAKAYIDLLEPEKEAADIIIENKIDVGKIQGAKDELPTKLDQDIYSDDKISIYIDNKSSLVIGNRAGILFKEKVTGDVIERILFIRDAIS
jgi:uridine kinase